MKIGDVTIWMGGCGSFGDGLAILETHREKLENPILVNVLKSGESTYTRGLMDDLMAELSRKNMSGDPEIITPIDDSETHQKRFSPADVAQLPDDLQKLYLEQIKSWYGEMNHQHGFLRMTYYNGEKPIKFPNEDVAHATIQKVMALDKKIKKAFTALDYYVQTGEYFPGTGPINELQQLREWLANHITFHNYVKNQTAKEKSGGQISDPKLFHHRRDELEKIKKYIQNI